jgi:hypothetical protein
MQRYAAAPLLACLLPFVVVAVDVAAAAAATSTEQAYIAARNATIAKIKAASDAAPHGPTDSLDDKILALDKEARAALERQMRAIVGPVAIKGMHDQGALNVDTLIEGDEDFGLLDGMIYGGIDAKTRIIVTTDGLFQDWLAEHKDWWGKDSPPLPQEPSAAVRDSDFYTQAVLTDAAIVRFADIPIRQPANAAFSYATLAARTQSDLPSKADEIFVTAEQGGRVFVATTKDFRAVGPIPACDAIHRDLAGKAAAEANDAGADDKTAQAAQDKAEALSAEADAEFLRCFATKASQQAGFAAATKAAQTLLDRLPMR